MPKKRPRKRLSTGPGPAPAVRARARNERHRRTDNTSRWLLAVGAAVGVLAIGWWALQAWPKAPSDATANIGSDRTISIGAQAPMIALPSTSGREVSLDEYRGSRLVVYFYEGVG